MAKYRKGPSKVRDDMEHFSMTAKESVPDELEPKLTPPTRLSIRPIETWEDLMHVIHVETSYATIAPTHLLINPNTLYECLKTQVGLIEEINETTVEVIDGLRVIRSFDIKEGEIITFRRKE